jgi:hypothetical protein
MRIPDRVQDLLPRSHCSGVFGEHREEVELLADHADKVTPGRGPVGCSAHRTTRRSRSSSSGGRGSAPGEAEDPVPRIAWATGSNQPTRIAFGSKPDMASGAPRTQTASSGSPNSPQAVAPAPPLGPISLDAMAVPIDVIRVKWGVCLGPPGRSPVSRTRQVVSATLTRLSGSTFLNIPVMTTMSWKVTRWRYPDRLRWRQFAPSPRLA